MAKGFLAYVLSRPTGKVLCTLLWFCKLAIYIGVYTFSFCANRMPGRLPAPSHVHSFSCRRKRTNQEKGGRPKLPFLWECLSWLNGRNSLRSNKRPFLTPCHSFSLCGKAAQPVIPVTGRLAGKCKQLWIVVCWKTICHSIHYSYMLVIFLHVSFLLLCMIK